MIVSSLRPEEKGLLAREFLAAYARESGFSREVLFEESLPFALNLLGDWLVGGKNAPRDELAWATQELTERRLMYEQG